MSEACEAVELLRHRATSAVAAPSGLRCLVIPDSYTPCLHACQPRMVVAPRTMNCILLKNQKITARHHGVLVTCDLQQSFFRDMCRKPRWRSFSSYWALELQVPLPKSGHSVKCDGSASVDGCRVSFTKMWCLGWGTSFGWRQISRWSFGAFLDNDSLVLNSIMGRSLTMRKLNSAWLQS